MERDVAALKILAILGLAGLTAAGQPQQGAPDDLEVSAVRFYRANAKSTQEIGRATCRVIMYGTVINMVIAK
jgi:hypothetical protein